MWAEELKSCQHIVVVIPLSGEKTNTKSYTVFLLPSCLKYQSATVPQLSATSIYTIATLTTIASLFSVLFMFKVLQCNSGTYLWYEYSYQTIPIGHVLGITVIRLSRVKDETIAIGQ